jgi:hypothetical protein
VRARKRPATHSNPRTKISTQTNPTKQVFDKVDVNNNRTVEAIEAEVAILSLYNVVNKRVPGECGARATDWPTHERPFSFSLSLPLSLSHTHTLTPNHPTTQPQNLKTTQPPHHQNKPPTKPRNK